MNRYEQIAREVLNAAEGPGANLDWTPAEIADAAAAIQRAVEEEREECAKLAAPDMMLPHTHTDRLVACVLAGVARSIRERGKGDKEPTR